jgi:hypothetical protein
VRIFEERNGMMAYVKDYCIVRADSQVPEADGWLSKWLTLLSDEARALSIVQSFNIFNPYSDSSMQETTLPVWREPVTVD